MEDVRQSGASLTTVKDSDTLKAKWLRPRLFIDGKEILVLPHAGPNDGRIEVRNDEYEREWKIGETIHISPVECQAIAVSLSQLGTTLLAEYEREMNAFLGI